MLSATGRFQKNGSNVKNGSIEKNGSNKMKLLILHKT